MRKFDDEIAQMYADMRIQLQSAFDQRQQIDFPLEVQAATMKGYLDVCFKQLDDLAK